jgi:conjugative relaxase-like TrwC/TraI family protein
VLRISKLSNGRADYYLLPTGVLGNKQIEAVGQWMGRGSSLIKLQGAVDKERWYSILAGIDPATGNVLSSNQGRVKVPGFDLTFCAPKSVSLLAGIGEEEVSLATVASHDRAVSTALDYLEYHGMAVRRTSAAHEKLILPVEGMVGANFLHRTARSLDPHLHTHSVVANLGVTTHLGLDMENSWSALDGRGLYAHRAAADALYHAVLRYELGSRLGVEWEQPVNGRADIKGIPREVILEFSTRTAQIAEYLDSRGISASGRARYIAGAATRPEKDLDISADDLAGQWRDHAMSLGMGPAQLDHVVGRCYMDKVEYSDTIIQSCDRVVENLAERDGSVCRRDVLRAWSGALVAGAPGEEINKAVDSVISLAGMSHGQDRAGIGVREERMEVPAIESAMRRSREAARETSREGALQGMLDRIGSRPEDEHRLAVWSDAYETIRDYSERWSGMPNSLRQRVEANDLERLIGQTRVQLRLGHEVVDRGMDYGLGL